MNSCFRRLFLPATFFFISVLSVFGMLLTVSIFHGGASATGPVFLGDGGRLGKALFPLLTVHGYGAILALGSVAGRLNKGSKLFLTTLNQALRRNGSRKPQMVSRWKSCKPIKVRFANNFVEISTPLTMLSLCLKVTVRLLLIA